MTEENPPGAVIAVHEGLRHEFARLPITVKAVADGNADRADVVAGHIALMCDWLEEFSGGQDGGEQLASECARIRDLAAAWKASPDHQERAALHAALIALERQVLHQLAVDEQRDAAPAGGAESQAVIETVLGPTDGDVRAIRIGLVVADASPANRVAFIAAIPADVRAWFDADGIAVYESYRAQLTDY